MHRVKADPALPRHVGVPGLDLARRALLCAEIGTTAALWRGSAAGAAYARLRRAEGPVHNRRVFIAWGLSP